jgi:hypothetical protein
MSTHQSETLGEFSEPSLISIDPSAVAFILECALPDPDEGLVLCLFYYLKETHHDKFGRSSEKGPGYQLGYYKTDYVPCAAIKLVGKLSMAFKLSEADRSKAICVAHNGSDFLVYEPAQ